MTLADASALQHRASHPAQHVWVSASAGSGKTTVLVNRLLRLLMGDGLPAPAVPHRILCLTYTKAAATEMQLRLNASLTRWTTMDKHALNQELLVLTGVQPDEAMRARARALFAHLNDSAMPLRIQTLHSFCQSVLARFPVEAGISPGFTALDEQQSQRLMAHAMESIWQQGGGTGWKNASAWAAQHFANATALRQTLPKLINEWPMMAAHLPDAEAEDDYWRACFAALNVPESEAAFWLAALSDTALPMEALRAWASKKKHTELFDFLASNAEERAARYDVYWDLIFTTKDEPRDKLPPALHAEADRLMRVRDVRLAAASAAMGMVLARTAREYAAQKDALAALDFTDMITKTAQLIKHPMGAWVHYKLDGGIDHILLDEAQDTSPVQWEIIHALAAEFFVGEAATERPRSLFVVGDPKQSIYSFQGADSSLFRRVEDDLDQRARDAQNPLQKVPLSHSFRTAPPVLAWVDATFAAADHTAALHGHSEIIQHHAIHAQRMGSARLYPLIPKIQNKKEKGLWVETNDEDTRQNARLAAQIAQTVSGWLSSGRQIAGEERAIEPQDILILIQQRTTLADALQSAFSAAGIPVMGSDRLVLSSAAAVKDILAVCKFLLFPYDDLNTAIVLRGPLIDLPEQDLERLCTQRGDQTVWQALNAARQYAAIADYLKTLLAATDHARVYDILARLLFLPCPADGRGGMAALQRRLGMGAADPVQELMRLAQQEGEENQPLGMGAFVQSIETSGFVLKREAAQQTQNVARILTVHGAKGLEAPIVILADASDDPNAHSSKQAKAVASGMKNPVFLYARRKEDAGPSFNRAESINAKSDEHQRLLYVAMTRASHELHVFGKANKDGDAPASWYAQLQSALVQLGAAESDQGVWQYGAADGFVTAAPAPLAVAARPLSVPRHALFTPLPAPMAVTRWIAEQGFCAPLAMPGNAPLQAALFGTAVHRLLEWLPEVPEPLRAEKAAVFLASAFPELQAAAAAEAVQHTLRTLALPDIRAFFSPHARAEVPVAGVWQGARLYGSIDRMVATDTEVGILDFKTSEPSTDGQIPPAYQMQIEIYAHFVRQIDPNRTVRAGILWTRTGEVVWASPTEKAAAA